MRHHCNCQCDTINQKWKWEVKLKVAITDVSTQPNRSHIHLNPCPWHDPPPQLTALVFTVQPTMADDPTNNDHITISLLVIWQIIWALRPDHKLTKQKPQQKPSIGDRLISCWLPYQTGNLRKPEPLVTVHKIFNKKNLPLVGSRRSETFWSVAKRDLGADGNLGRWPGSLVIRGGRRKLVRNRNSPLSRK